MREDTSASCLHFSLHDVDEEDERGSLHDAHALVQSSREELYKEQEDKNKRINIEVKLEDTLS